MKLNEFFEMLDSDDFLRTDYIVLLKYKYDWEKEYTIDNEYLEYDGNHDDWVWLHDWNEGQTDVEVLGYKALEDVEVVPSTHTLVEQVPVNGVVCTLTLKNVQGIEGNKFKEIYEEAITWLHRFCWKVRG